MEPMANIRLLAACSNVVIGFSTKFLENTFRGDSDIGVIQCQNLSMT